MLTVKQAQLLKYIDGRIKVHGVCPTYDEMRVAMGLASKCGIHRLITGLEERGFIHRLPHRARAIEVIRLPGEADPDMVLVPREPTDRMISHGDSVMPLFAGKASHLAGADVAVEVWQAMIEAYEAGR